MASLVSGIFDLAAGNPAQKEQDQFGALGAYDTGTGEALTTAGAGEELGILSGDPTKIAQVEAPEISAQQKQIEQQRLQDANFGTRSGGTTASTAAAEAGGRANIIDLTGNLIGNTAGAAVGQGTNLIGQAGENIGNEAQLAEERRKQVTGDVGDIATGAGQIVSGIMGGDFGGGDTFGPPDPEIAASRNDWGQGPTPPGGGVISNDLYAGLGGYDLPSIL